MIMQEIYVDGEWHLRTRDGAERIVLDHHATFKKHKVGYKNFTHVASNKTRKLIKEIIAIL
jgi:uncharacterized lipoprotein YmbA